MTVGNSVLANSHKTGLERMFLISLFFLILLFIVCVFCSVTIILLHCGSFCHENEFLVCVNIPGNKAPSDSVSELLGHFLVAGQSEETMNNLMKS